MAVMGVAVYEYEEPLPGLTKDGVEITAHRTIRMTRENIINHERAVLAQTHGKERALRLCDEDLLDEFGVIHYVRKAP